MVNKTLQVKGTDIAVDMRPDASDYICLTDMARFQPAGQTEMVVQNWMRTSSTVEYLGTWEMLHNPHFKQLAYDRLLLASAQNSFTLTPTEWVNATGAIGVYTRKGQKGGIYAHRDLAFGFGMWLSPTFQLYVVREYEQLCQSERGALPTEWDVKRILSKVNYTLHTEAIHDHILPTLSLNDRQARLVYATEADLLNLAVFGCTAKDWAEANPQLAAKHNIRDTASINELVVLSNMESLNSVLIEQGVDRGARYTQLSATAERQLRLLNENNAEQRFRRLRDAGMLPD